MPDGEHVCMVHETHFKLFSDWIYVKNFGTASPGDIFELVYYEGFDWFLFLWIVLMIKDANSGRY